MNGKDDYIELFRDLIFYLYWNQSDAAISTKRKFRSRAVEILGEEFGSLLDNYSRRIIMFRMKNKFAGVSDFPDRIGFDFFSEERIKELFSDMEIKSGSRGGRPGVSPEKIKMMCDMYESGYSLSEIARELKIAVSTVHKYVNLGR